MKDLFTGSLGHLDNHGGSPMFTTPNTIYVPPEYEIETDVPSVAEFVTCSLDGRLWVWKRSRRYYVSAFRWNEETERLVFVSTTILNGETVQKRGVDWILTDKSLLRSQAEAPYISRTEYDSDDSTYSDAIEKCYSFWSELETWQKIQSGQVLSIDGSPDDKWQEVAQNNIISMAYLKTYGLYMNFDIKVCYRNEYCYAKCDFLIGKAYLIPCIFDMNGMPETFYFHISPDYIREFDTESQEFSDNDGWNNFAIAPINNNSVGVFTPEDDDSIVCKKAENGLVYKLPQGEQADYSVNHGAIFFDGFSGSNLVLNNQGASFLHDNVSYQCKGLQQWLAPNNKIYNISQHCIISSINNATIATFEQQEFYRQLITSKNIPSTIGHLDKNLSLKDTLTNNFHSIQANTMHINSEDSCIDWNNIFSPIWEISKIYEEDISDKDYLFTSEVQNYSLQRFNEMGNTYTISYKHDASNSHFQPLDSVADIPLYNRNEKIRVSRMYKSIWETSYNNDIYPGVYTFWVNYRYNFSSPRPRNWYVDYIFFYDTYLHLPFYISLPSTTDDYKYYIPLLKIDDNNSYYIDDLGNKVCLRSIHSFYIYPDLYVEFEVKINRSALQKFQYLR